MRSIYTTNLDIRQYMEDRGITQGKLAERMGIHRVDMCRKLQVELSSAEKERICNIIDDIHAETMNRCVKPSENSDASEDTGITHSTKFLIGDRVKIPSKSGKIGNVADIWTSLYQNAVMYAVDDESGNRGLYAENQLEAAPVPITYRFTATIDGNVAVVCMYAAEGDKETVISRGHAHIIHDGPTGLAQAASYAAKRMFESLDRQNENRIYCKEDY